MEPPADAVTGGRRLVAPPPPLPPPLAPQYKVLCTDGACKNCDCHAVDSLCVTWCALSRNCPRAEVVRGTCPTSLAGGDAGVGAPASARAEV